MRRTFLTILFLATLAVPGCAADLTSIEGRVAVAGNAPFTYVRVIAQDDIEYKLVGPKADILRRSWQGRIVRLEGKVVKEAIGRGFPAEFEVRSLVEAEKGK